MGTKLTKAGRIIGGICALALVTIASVAALRPKPPRPPEQVTSVADLDAYLTALTASYNEAVPNWW